MPYSYNFVSFHSSHTKSDTMPSSTDPNITMTMMEREWGVEAVFVLATLQAIFIVVGSIGNLLVMISILLTRHKCDR